MKTDTNIPVDRLPVGVCSRDMRLRDELVRQLEIAGFPAKIVHTSAAGARSRVHTLVVDVDGLDVPVQPFLSAVRAANPETVMVAIGSDPNPDMLVTLMRAGCIDFLNKPVDPPAVAARVRSAWERASIRRLSAAVTRRLGGREESGAAQSPPEPTTARRQGELDAVNEKLHKAVSQVRTLYHMGRDLADNENWSDALDRFLMALVNFMEAEGAALLLFSNHEAILRPRSTFHMDTELLERACGDIVGTWKTHPRAQEIHPLESYRESRPAACLERSEAWGVSVIPLRHRNRTLGFLLLEKSYADGFAFKSDYDFISGLQTIFVEELANASYISELRRLGRFNNKVLDNIRSGVITTDVDGLVRYHNVWASDMCPRLRNLKQRGAEPVHFDAIFASRQYPSDFFATVMHSRKGSHVLEVECHGGAEDPFPARLRLTKMFDDNLNAVVLVAIFEDLTAQRRMEAEIRRNDRLRVLGQLSASVAHEIRNPLTGIANCAEVLASKLGDDEEKTKYTRAMLDEIRRLDGIIRNLLTFARPPRPQLAPCRVSDVVDRVGVLLGEQASQKGIQIETRGVDRALLCEADPGLLTQVLLNLVVNAIQACDEGDEVRVQALSAPAPSGAQVARIEVIDSGPGVPREVRESLFEPFVTTKTQGTGLGLAISQQIVEEHHGTMDCDFLKKGTRFYIDLPESKDPTTKPVGAASAGG